MERLIAHDMLPTYLNREDLEYLETLPGSDTGHIQTLFKIRRIQREENTPTHRVCTCLGCQKPGDFLKYIRPHQGTHHILITCERHIPRYFREAAEKKQSG